jgi:inosine-uridine nucleoside N-ribohydrolase
VAEREERIPVLLDTDIGSDIDDAVCLAYLLRQPRCELVGVTTVTGEVAQRAALSDVICRAAGRTDVPIHAGAGPVLLYGPGQPRVPQYEAIRGRPHRKDFPAGDAIEFMRRTIRTRPGAVTLLAIGPFTNVALLFATDPEIPALLRELVIMGGVFTAGNGHGPAALEWNARVDPLATAIMFRARPPRFTAIGLEVTTRCRLSATECRRRFATAGGPLTVVAEMAEVWFRGREQLTFHDPLAAAVLFEPELCDYADGLVSVSIHDEALAGLTQFRSGGDEKPHRIATAVQPERFFDHYFGAVGG